MYLYFRSQCLVQLSWTKHNFEDCFWNVQQGRFISRPLQTVPYKTPKTIKQSWVLM